MKPSVVERGTVLGLVAVAAACACAMAFAPGILNAGPPPVPQPLGPCGQVFHNFPRVLNMNWTAVPGANGYQVEVDCRDCKVVGKWDSETPAGDKLFGVTTNTATFTFWADNPGRWRVRATQTATAPGMSAIQAGPWSVWCDFSFRTKAVLGEPVRGRPDITAGVVDPSAHSKPGVVIGGAPGGSGGKFAPWGGSVVVSDGDAAQQSGGKCAFNVTYAMSNLGPVATSPAFVNRLRSDGHEVAVNSGLSLAAGEKNHKITTQPYLDPGPHTLQLSLDDAPGAVAESDEANNIFWVRYALNGKCAGPQPGQPCGMALVFTLSTTSGHPGDTFEMIGTWGATQGTKVPRINKGGPHDLQVLSWSNAALKVRIPTPLDPGVYKVGVYCAAPELGATQSTEFLDFTVLPK